MVMKFEPTRTFDSLDAFKQYVNSTLWENQRKPTKQLHLPTNTTAKNVAESLPNPQSQIG